MADFYYMSDKEREAFFSEWVSDIKELIGEDVSIQFEGDHYQVELSSGKQVAGWMLKEMPGCCGMCVSTGAYVMPDFRQRGLGKLLNNLRIAIATELKFGMLFCTDILANEPQQKILANNGWSQIDEFKNPKTNNVIGLHSIKL